MKHTLSAGIIWLVVSCSSPSSQQEESASQTDTLAISTQVATADTLAHADSHSPWQDKINKGIDFIAKGNEPFWSVEIDVEKGMFFKSMNGDSLYTPVPKPDYAQDAPIMRYAATTEAGTLHVTLERKKCVDDMSGQEYPFTVSVAIKKGNETEYKSYKGCGRNIGSYQLDNIWVLETANGQALDSTLFAGKKPNVQFRLSQNKMSGFGGCNRIQGNITLAGDTLRLGPVMATKMACPASAFETKLLSQLSEQSFTFQVSQEKLILRNKQHTLTFKPLH